LTFLEPTEKWLLDMPRQSWGMVRTDDSDTVHYQAVLDTFKCLYCMAWSSKQMVLTHYILMQLRTSSNTCPALPHLQFLVYYYSCHFQLTFQGHVDGFSTSLELLR
jgi:hypothetical protein